MSAKDLRKPFPTFPASCWWPLRERFKRSIPALVDITYLQSVLGVERKTGRNLVPMLRLMGLIDENGVPTERAGSWRIDSEYPAVCRRIRDELYPASLRMAVPSPADDFAGCVRWFMTSTRVGEAAARRMARFYALLSTADASQNADARKRADGQSRHLRRFSHDSNGAPPPARAHWLSPSNTSLNDNNDSAASTPGDVVDIARSDGPVTIVLQLLIGPGTTADQIDQVFASIARHLGSGGLH